MKPKTLAGVYPPRRGRRGLSYAALGLTRRSLLIAFSVFIVSAVAADVKPVDSSKPLFRILKFKTLHDALRKGDEAKGEVDDKHPLLVVWKLRDVQLATDRHDLFFHVYDGFYHVAK